MPDPQNIALLQYTSGSTGNPKGVMLTHANLLANIRAMGQKMQVDANDVLVSWLPLYHDMGLIGAWFAPMYFGITLVVMSPLTFLARPERWLRAIDRYRGTITAAPNFAYERCARHLDEADLDGLDLSSLRFSFCGAEPVSPDTMRAFAARFKSYGFDEHALTSVYGLAENTLGLTFPPPGRGLRIDQIQREPLGATQTALPAMSGDHFIELVGCGQPLAGTESRIVDAYGLELPERRVGRVEFRGTSATSGYYRNPEQTARLIHDGWLDTGDLGYFADGELFITGRTKDMIIRGGRHFFPQELEDAIGRMPGIRSNCVAVCGSTDPLSGTERVVILAETAETDSTVRTQLVAHINAVTIALLSAPAEQVSLVPPLSILKTPSGKIRHAATLELLQRSGQRLAARPQWRQLADLARDSIAPVLKRCGRQVAHVAYGTYCWAALAAIAPVVWCMVVLHPDTRRNWQLSASACRLFLRIIGLHVENNFDSRTIGPERVIMAANHTSYLDGLVLLATLPRPVSFVAKRELNDQRFVGRFLRAIGTCFVERRDYRGSLEDEARLIDRASADDTLLFFPEGTFGRAAGLRTFHLGAFRAACVTKRPVIPVALAGVRAILPDGNWLPRRGRIALTLLAPVLPDGNDFPAVTRLRDEVYHAISLHCAEPRLTCNFTDPNT
ncbi:AMP-binding protein [Caballeronia sp. LjRoot29]|uniref:AMP-binding protein n=1 Tax=Caballeronia sp. LjRoot29 TaxID=3342315 RepID=UPI003ECD2A84